MRWGEGGAADLTCCSFIFKNSPHLYFFYIKEKISYFL